MKIILTPDWFLGKDVLIDIFSFIVLFAFFLLCLKYYKLNRKKNNLYLGVGFLLIAVAQIATIITKLILYYDTSFTQQIGQMIITYNLVKSVDIFYYAGFFFHKFLTLLGFYIIYRLPIKKRSRGDFFLVLYFILSLTAFALIVYLFNADFNLVNNYFFYLTTLIILGLIIRNYSIIYKKNKLANTKILIVAFSMLALSNAIFILSKLSVMFVIANIIELFSYMILLFLMIKILRVQYNIKTSIFLKHGRKKKQDRYYL